MPCPPSWVDRSDRGFSPGANGRAHSDGACRRRAPHDAHVLRCRARRGVALPRSAAFGSRGPESWRWESPDRDAHRLGSLRRAGVTAGCSLSLVQRTSMHRNLLARTSPRPAAHPVAKLGLERLEGPIHHRAVQATARAARAALDPVLLEQTLADLCGALESAIGLMREPRGRRAHVDRHHERALDERRGIGLVCRRGDGMREKWPIQNSSVRTCLRSKAAEAKNELDVRATPATAWPASRRSARTFVRVIAKRYHHSR